MNVLCVYVKMGDVVENLNTGRKSCNDISDIELILREKQCCVDENLSRNRTEVEFVWFWF